MEKIKTLRIAVLQAGRAADGLESIHGDYDDMCKALIGRAPQDADTFAVIDGEFPPSVGAYDAFIITGSRHAAYDDLPWIAPLEAFIREAYAQEKKIIGVCFGHQILAQALGGDVRKSDKGWGLGAMDYELKLDSAEPRTITLYAWHQDQVVAPPKGAETIAHSAFCNYAALRYGERAISFQAHPEFTREYLHDLAEARRGSTLPGELTDAAIASLERPADAGLVRDILVAFLAQ